MNEDTLTIIGSLTLIVGFFFLLFVIVFVTYNSNSGTHKGYVTAVDQSGIFFRNYKVYFKTNPQSSQEDVYCVRNSDSQLAEDLRKAQSEGKEITVRYDGDRGVGLGMCKADRIRSYN